VKAGGGVCGGSHHPSATAATTILPSARRCIPTQILPCLCAHRSDRPRALPPQPGSDPLGHLATVWPIAVARLGVVVMHSVQTHPSRNREVPKVHRSRPPTRAAMASLLASVTSTDASRRRESDSQFGVTSASVGSHDTALLTLGCRAMRLAGIMLPVTGFQIVSAGYFQAVGKPRQAMLLMVSRQVLLLIPAVLLLPGFFGLDGVWLALPTSDCLACLITGGCIFLELRRLNDARNAAGGLEGHAPETAAPGPE